MTRRGFAAALMGPLTLHAADTSKSALRVDLGPEQLIATGVRWPYLFQAREGTTVLLGLIEFPPGGKYPIHYTARSFDGRKTWQEWKPGPAHGRGPITEGSTVQLRDGRILVFDVHAEHVGGKRFEASFWTSNNAFQTLEGPRKYGFVLPEAEVSSFDDRGEPISRMYLRRSVIELKNGDLLATAYGHFEADKSPVEYMPKMYKMRSFLLRSGDQGKTWTYVSTIASDPVEQEGFGEPVLLQLRHGPNAGRLICQTRTGRENPVYQCESDDEGKTWTKAYALRWTYSRFGRQRDIAGTDPDLIEMGDGTLVMSFGHKPDYREHGNYLAFSLDHGKSWTQVTQISSTITSAYTGVRETSPGELFVVYTTSKTNPEDAGGVKYITMGRGVRLSKP